MAANRVLYDQLTEGNPKFGLQVVGLLHGKKLKSHIQGGWPRNARENLPSRQSCEQCNWPPICVERKMATGENICRSWAVTEEVRDRCLWTYNTNESGHEMEEF